MRDENSDKFSSLIDINQKEEDNSNDMITIDQFQKTSKDDSLKEKKIGDYGINSIEFFMNLDTLDD